MLPGLAATLNCPSNLPPPLLASVPMIAPFAAVETVSVALALLLVASTRSWRFEVVNSARVTATESAAGAGVAVGVGVGVGTGVGAGVGVGTPFGKRGCKRT